MAAQGRETVTASGGDLPPGDRSSNKEIPSSSVPPWVATEMTGSLGLLSCVYYVYLEWRAGVVLPPDERLYFFRVLPDYHRCNLQLWDHSPKPPECVPSQLLYWGRGPSSA